MSSDQSQRRAYFLPFEGLVVPGTLWLEGQIMWLDPQRMQVTRDDSAWSNFLLLLHLYRAKRPQNEPLEIRLNGESHRINLDEKGFFRFRVPLQDTGEIPLKAREMGFYLVERDEQVVLHPDFSDLIVDPGSFRFGVISDIDDTILVSHANQPFRRVMTVIFNNAFRRKEVADMSEMYRSLAEEECQVFYVSNSERNLYLPIRLFLNNFRFPKGPVYLRNTYTLRQLIRRFWKSYPSDHKAERIAFLLEQFPQKEFFLVGDSGQHDPDLYLRMNERYPGRIKAILIHNISKGKALERLEEIAQQSNAHGLPFVLFQEAREAKRYVEGLLTSPPNPD